MAGSPYDDAQKEISGYITLLNGEVDANKPAAVLIQLNSAIRQAVDLSRDLMHAQLITDAAALAAAKTSLNSEASLLKKQSQDIKKTLSDVAVAAKVLSIAIQIATVVASL